MQTNNKHILKEEEIADHDFYRENQQKFNIFSLPELCPPPFHQNHIENFYQGFNKKSPSEPFQMNNLLNHNPDDPSEKYQSIYDDFKNGFHDGRDYPQYMSMPPHHWYVNNNNFMDRVKQEEQENQKYWNYEIKDEYSNDLGRIAHEFRAIDIKQEIDEFVNDENVPEDVNKFIAPYPDEESNKKTRRRVKVEAYLKKKKQRSFEKKIIYKCRKEVADNRIRYKGRFISSQQALKIIGVNQDELLEVSDIKALLDNKKKQKQPVYEMKDNSVKQQNK